MTTVVLPDFPIEGGCVCGAVRYRVTAPPLTLYACHCRDCQRQSGSAYGLSMRVARASLDLLRGTPRVQARQADSGRTRQMFFCPDCGTRLWNATPPDLDPLTLKPGTLDDSAWIVPVGHIWFSRRQAGTVVAPDALVIPGQPENFGPLCEAWTRAIATCC